MEHNGVEILVGGPDVANFSPRQGAESVRHFKVQRLSRVGANLAEQ